MGEAFFATIKFFSFLAVLWVLLYVGQILYGILFDSTTENPRMLPRVGCFAVFVFVMTWMLFAIIKC